MVRELGSNPSACLLVALEGDITSISLSERWADNRIYFGGRGTCSLSTRQVPRSSAGSAGRARSIRGPGCCKPGVSGPHLLVDEPQRVLDVRALKGDGRG